MKHLAKWPDKEPADNGPEPLIFLREVRALVAAEEEMPCPMSDEMWENIRNDRDACTEVMRLAVRLAKSGILERINKLKSANENPLMKCEMCGDEIHFAGNCWKHVTGTPRHPATPINAKSSHREQ